jgi:hypothetical protein
MPGLRAPPPGGYYLPDHTRKRPFSAAREGAAKVPRPGESRTMPIFLDDAPRHIPPPQGQSCGDTNTFRAAAHERLLRRPNLATESARRQAVAEGRTQTRAMEIERDCERSALQLACVIPPYALAQLLGENPAFLPIDEGLAMLVAIIRSRGGAKNLHEATNMWRRLLTRMDERGVRHNERASRVDTVDFLQHVETSAMAKSARDKARRKRGPSDPNAPPERSGDGSSAATGALAKLRSLADFYFDVAVDKLHIFAPRGTGPPKRRDTAPTPSLAMMKMFQRVAADPTKPTAVRNLCWSKCVCAFAVIRAEQASHVELAREIIIEGNRFMCGITKKKTRAGVRAIPEPFILPLSGVLGNDSWWTAGLATLDHLPAPGAFLCCDFEAPRGSTNNPYHATAMRNNPMPQQKQDKAMQIILAQELGMSAFDAAKFTQHSMKHFMLDITSYLDDPETAKWNELELGRWSGSTLARDPHLAPADRQSGDFLLNATRVSRVYSANSTMIRLCKLSQQQLTRAQGAITRAGAALPTFGGWHFLHP